MTTAAQEYYFAPNSNGWPSRRTNVTDPVNQGKNLVFKITNQYTDAEQIVAALADFAYQFGQDQTVRNFVIGNLPSIGNNDLLKQIGAVLALMKLKLVYVRDPSGLEYVQSPIELIKTICAYGTASGDCDDHVLLFNSMLNSLEFETKVVAVKINGASYFNHVISSVKLNGVWTDFDTCNKNDPVKNYPGPRIEMLS